MGQLPRSPDAGGLVVQPAAAGTGAARSGRPVSCLSATQAVSLAPGRFYRRTWILPACGAVLAFVILATPEASTVAYLEAVVVACVLLASCLLLPAYYRRTRTVVVDPEGVHLLVGRRSRKVMPWNRISRVYLGPRHRMNGLLGVYDGFGLMVVGRNPADSINLVDSWFTVDANVLPAFAATVERMAETRSIPVYTRFGAW